MKIEFLTQDDPLYVLPFFDEFVRHYASEFQVRQISSSRIMGKRSRWQMLKELTQLYRIRGMALLIARVIRSRLAGKLPKKQGARRFHTLEQLCRAHGITHANIGNPNEPDFVRSVEARGADLLISVACPYILKKQLLEVAPLGAINIHHAPLPRYKGMMPTFWQMFHNEKSVGLTIHYMAAKIDEGEALLQDRVAIEPEESLDHLIQRTKRQAAHCMASVLRQIRDGSARSVAMDHSNGTYFTFPTAAEIDEFHRRGLRVI